MQIKIGSILYIGGDSPFRLAPPVQGLESPAIRIGDGLYAGRDGGFVSGHFYGHRTITINGFYIGADCEEASELRETLFGLLRIRYRHPIIITTKLDNFLAEGFVSNVKADIESLVSGKFQITLLCPDPLLYQIPTPGNVESIYNSRRVDVVSSATTTINSASSVDTYPIITWTGTFPGFTITNTTTGKTFSIATNLPNGNTVIDFKRRTIMVGNTCYNANRAMNSEWWPLIPGENVITISNSSGGTNWCNVKWIKEARAGI